MNICLIYQAAKPALYLDMHSILSTPLLMASSALLLGSHFAPEAFLLDGFEIISQDT